MSVLRRGWHAVVWAWDHSIGFVLTWILIGIISAYRLVVSPVLPPTCRYHPSCSAYGLEAVRTHKAVKGAALTTWRIVRCNPWTKGGYDPVPAPGHWLPDVRPDGRLRSGTMDPPGPAAQGSSN